MKITARDFDLQLSLGCGQAFGWAKNEGWFCGFISGRPVAVRQEGKTIEWKGRATAKEVASYFRLGDDLKKMRAAVAKDPAVRHALSKSPGLRLLRQGPWECSVSFICASYANIPRIGKMLDNLRKTYGKRMKAGDAWAYSFPTPGQLASAPLGALRKCGLGYRAEYVKAFAQAVKGKELDFGALKRMPYAQAKAELMKQMGIGEKVADCILLFSLDHLEAFPVDVWIKRIMVAHYGKQIAKFARNPRRISDQEIRAFAQRHFGPLAGYAQQCLYAERKNLCKPGKPAG